MTNLDLIVEAFDGDYLQAFLFCEKLAGITITIPKDAHRILLAKKMIEHEFDKLAINAITSIHPKVIRRHENIYWRQHGRA